MPEAKQAEGARFLLSVQQLGFSLLEFSLLQITRCNVHVVIACIACIGRAISCVCTKTRLL